MTAGGYRGAGGTDGGIDATVTRVRRRIIGSSCDGLGARCESGF